MPPYQILFCDVCKDNEKNYYESKCKEALTGNVYCYHYWIKIKKCMTNKYNEKTIKTESMAESVLQVPTENCSSNST